MRLLYFFIYLFYAEIRVVFGATETSLNLTHFNRHRQRRALTFAGGGIIKLAIGPILPFDLGDATAFRSALSFYNLQGGEYRLPNNPLYPWDKFGTDTSARSLPPISASQSPNGSTRNEPAEDDSRLLVYTILEQYMDERHSQGRECLLRAICENAQTDQHVGLLAELLNILLTPGQEILDPVYGASYVAGKSGVDCLRLHCGCPAGASWLDQFMENL